MNQNYISLENVSKIYNATINDRDETTKTQ